MKEIIKKLKETRVIYDSKLNDAIDELKKMSVKDKNFDTLLNRVSSLISLMLQEEKFISEYTETEKLKKEEK